MSFASTAGWQAGPAPRTGLRPPRRGLEIAGIILGFIVAWPLALAYLVWKMMGYPVPTAWKTSFEKNFSFLSGGFAAVRPASPTGNRAFDDYRDRELARLEEERRRLDEEAHAFAEFVEELKRAKDREEFDAFMAKRRGAASA
ncbi:MAG TPA: DUF2852 domain-containing protein [Microvirga sp.]|jgi:hypothetical protein|nr:DUF2852 domain-containing protein [Microvirga sp.]